MTSLAALTLLPLLVAGQAPSSPAPVATPPAPADSAAAAQPAPASAAPAATVTDVAPAKSAIPEEFGLPPGYTFVIAKVKSTLYGFVEADSMYDTTRSFIDLPGMSAIALPGTENGDDGRLMFSIRNSRLGYRLEAPEFHGLRASGLFEMDFLGNQPGTPPTSNTSTSSPVSQSESAYWNNPTFRVRHALLKLDNDFVTLWFGQTWELVGWQGAFQPNTVAIQGVPGELYSRTAQIRALHAFKLGPTTLEIALAALRPPQEDSAIPDFQGGLKLTIDGWTGVQTIGATNTGIQPAAIGFSGALRTYKLANGESADAETTQTGWAGAADIMIPIIPAKARKAWALTFVGEFVEGSGDADLYTSLKGGSPSVGTPPNYAGTYAADIDSGLAGWSSVTGNLETIDWQTFILSAQFYLPPDGKIWISGSYSNSLSDNIGEFGKASAVFFHEIWWDVNVFAEVTPSVRLGLEYANFNQTYGSGVQAPDQRGQFSAWYIF